jgi:anti-sigma regulatory factor (Ser/Thr protein kinase)
MEDISLHILDIVENSITAGANRVEIKIIEDIKNDILSIEIKDNGRGMSKEILSKVLDPFYTTRTTRSVGMGLSLLAQSAKEAEGDISITSEEDSGTTVYVFFKHSHIDRKPLGNIADTIITLIAGNPGIDLFYEHKLDNNIYTFDTALIKTMLEDVPINSPKVIQLIRNDISEGLKELD